MKFAGSHASDRSMVLTSGVFKGAASMALLLQQLGGQLERCVGVPMLNALWRETTSTLIEAANKTGECYLASRRL
jgi:hypothetical protein